VEVKKVLAALAVLVLAGVALTGCGGTESEASQAATKTVTAPPETVTEKDDQNADGEGEVVREAVKTRALDVQEAIRYTISFELDAPFGYDVHNYLSPEASAAWNTIARAVDDDNEISADEYDSVSEAVSVLSTVVAEGLEQPETATETVKPKPKPKRSVAADPSVVAAVDLMLTDEMLKVFCAEREAIGDQAEYEAFVGGYEITNPAGVPPARDVYDEIVSRC
jgi:hypothetical protein